MPEPIVDGLNKLLKRARERKAQDEVQYVKYVGLDHIHAMNNWVKPNINFVFDDPNIRPVIQNPDLPQPEQIIVEDLDPIPQNFEDMLKYPPVAPKKALMKLTNDSLISDIFTNAGRPLCNQDVGIEIEVEGISLPTMRSKYWKSIKDGSLRGDDAKEYVSVPLYKREVNAALTELKTALEVKKAITSFSFRTSVHIHLNCQDLSLNRVKTLCYLYYLFEEAFFQVCADHRRGNRFCLSLREAENILDNMSGYLKVDRVLRGIPENQIRYAALNIAPLSKYGTVELRTLEGTLDSQKIMSWITAFDALKRAVFVFSSPLEVYQYLQDNGGIVLFNKVFTKPSREFLSYRGLAEDVIYNASLLINIPFEV